MLLFAGLLLRLLPLACAVLSLRLLGLAGGLCSGEEHM